VRELGLLDREQKHRPAAQVERHRFFLELSVNRQRLREELVDPRGWLWEEEAAVPSRCAGPNAAGIDEDDARAALGKEARSRTAGEAGADDDAVGARQLCGDSLPPRAAPTPATAAAITPPRFPPTAWRAFRLAIGFPSVRTSQPMNAFFLLNIRSSLL
jgi:hypothetical protein